MRRRYVYRETSPGVVEAIEVGAETEVPARLQVVTDGHYDGLRATDGVPIDTRKRHREYMRFHNLCLADEVKPDWERAAKKREAVFRGEHDVGARREAIIRTMETKGRKR